MSYWGSPGASAAAWGAARHGPSPMVPFLVVMALGWVICNETLMGWYEQVTEVQETVASNGVVLIIAAGLLLLAVVLLNTQMELVLAPAVLVLVMVLINNILIAALLLLLVVYFAGIYYHPSRHGHGGVCAGGDWGHWAGSGLGFYMLLLLCLVLCAMFSEEGGSWWIPGLLLAACLLCLNLFSGGFLEKGIESPASTSKGCI